MRSAGWRFSRINQAQNNTGESHASRIQRAVTLAFVLRLISPINSLVPPRSSPAWVKAIERPAGSTRGGINLELTQLRCLTGIRVFRDV